MGVRKSLKSLLGYHRREYWAIFMRDGTTETSIGIWDNFGVLVEQEPAPQTESVLAIIIKNQPRTYYYDPITQELTQK